MVTSQVGDWGFHDNDMIVVRWYIARPRQARKFIGVIPIFKNYYFMDFLPCPNVRGGFQKLVGGSAPSALNIQTI